MENLCNARLAIIGGGKFCKGFLEFFLSEDFVDQRPEILGVAALDEHAPGLRYAKEKGIFTTNNHKDIYTLENLDIIMELTGDNALCAGINNLKPAKVRLINHFEAGFLWNSLQIEREKNNTLKKLSKCSHVEKAADLFKAFSDRIEEIVTQRTAYSVKIEKDMLEHQRAIFQILEGSTLPTFVINKDHIVTHWNKALEKFSGYSASEIVGTRKQWLPFRTKQRPVMADIILDQLNEEEIEKYYGATWRKSALIEGAYEAEEFFPHLGENGKWAFFTGAPIKGPDKRIIGAIETFWDTTKNKNAEIENARLQEQYIISEKKYRSLFNNDPNPIFIIDSKTLNILNTNQRAETCYGYSGKELSQMPFTQLGDENDQELINVLKKISKDHSMLFSKKRHYKKGNIPFYVTINVSYAKYHESDVLIATTTDVTESVEKETQLIQASKMTTLGVMAAGMAHEINQPLNVIQVCADFFKKKIAKGQSISEQDLEMLSTDISNNVQRAAGIIKHMRDFARQSEAVRSKVKINDPIKDVFKVLGHQLKVHQIELKLDLAPDIPYIMAEHNRLEQVFINLVTNAVDAMDEKSSKSEIKKSEKRLEIKSFVKGSSVVVTVSDSGTGMSQKVIDKIFEPFFTTKDVGKGTGLGVSISYGIVKDYDGDIKITSEIGKGTTFQIIFPVVD